MAYGHAERNLGTIRLLEAETAELLDRLPALDAEQSAWRREVAERNAGRGAGGYRFRAQRASYAAPLCLLKGEELDNC
jgi:hypothetical protein